MVGQRTLGPTVNICHDDLDGTAVTAIQQCDNSNSQYAAHIINPVLPFSFSPHSTMSSCLNALSAVTWQDFLKPMLEHRLTEAQKTLVTKLLGEWACRPVN